MEHLQDVLKKSEQGLSTAEGHISSLQETQEILQKELELTQAKLRETADSLYNVEVNANSIICIYSIRQAQVVIWPSMPYME